MLGGRSTLTSVDVHVGVGKRLVSDPAVLGWEDSSAGTDEDLGKVALLPDPLMIDHKLQVRSAASQLA
jgi:hypothetical protein